MKFKNLFSNPDREQVDFNLPLPSITPKPLQEGQYSISVERTPDASQTSMGRLAAALGQINPLIAKYGEAQMATTDLQNIQMEQELAEMTATQQGELLKNKEAGLNKLLRDDYEANPVVTYRAKMLLGANKAPEFAGMLSGQMEEFTNELVKKQGDKPSAAQVSSEIDRITAEYIKNDENLSANAMMKVGFLQEISQTIKEYKANLPGQIAQTHKNDVLIPNVAKALAQAHLQGKGDFEDAYSLKEYWETYTGGLKKGDHEKIVEEALALLNFDSSPDALTKAKDFLTDLSNADIRIGNEPINSDKDPLARNFYTKKYADLEAMEEQVDRDYKAKLVRDAEPIREEVYEMVSKETGGDISVDTLEEKFLNPKIEEIKQSTTESLPQQFKIEAARAGFDSATRQTTKNKKEISEDLYSAVPGSKPIAFEGQLRNRVGNLFDAEFSKDEYEHLDIKSILIIEPIPPGTTNQGSSYAFKTIGIGEDANKIITQNSIRYQTLLNEGIEQLSNIKVGDSISIFGEDDPITIDDKTPIKTQRKTIAAKYATNIQNSIFEETIDNLVKIADGMKSQRKEDEIVKTSVDEAIKAEDNERKLAEKSISLATGKMVEGRQFEGGAFGLKGLAIEPRGAGEALGTVLGAVAAPPIDFDKAVKGMSLALKTKAHPPGVTQEIMRRMGVVHQKSIPYLSKDLEYKKANYKDAKANGTDLGPLGYIEVGKELEEARDLILKGRRLFTGYSVKEVKEALKTGKGDKFFLEEGVGIIDPKNFFLMETTGAGEGPYAPSKYKASALINYENEQELEEVSSLLGLEANEFKRSQDEFRRYLRGEKEFSEETPLTEEPEVIETPEISETPEEQGLELKVKRKTKPDLKKESDVKVDTKVSTVEGEDPSEPTDVKVGTRISTIEQLDLDLDPKLDDSLVNFVKKEERFIPNAYDDFKQTSIGYGTRAKKGEKTITKEEASKRLSEELNKHAKRVKDHAKKYNYKLNQNQMNALISFDYNTGSISELTAKGTRSLPKIAEMMLLYYNAGGKKKEGLVKRRAREQKLFLKPMSKDQETQ